MILFPLAITAALAVMLTIATSNHRRFPRLRTDTMSPSEQETSLNTPPARRHTSLQAESVARHAGDVSGAPHISVLIPARNEAAIIGATLHSLLAQDVADLEVLVLDDRSEDATAEVVCTAARHSPQIKLLCGKELPPGWTGKNWACAQLVEAAQGDILIFTDADVCWRPGALRSVLATIDEFDADLLTVWPTQVTESWIERLTVPMMAMVVMGYLPVWLAHDFYHPLAAAANGQCMVFQRPAYAAIGGHAAVHGAIVEDVRLAQNIKAAGLKLRMVDGAGLIACHMYNGARAAIDGYTKNILAGHQNRISLLALSTLFHWSLFLAPWLWLLFGWMWPLPGWPLWPLLLIAAGVGVRVITAHATRQRVGDAPLLPVSVLIFTWIAARAVWWRLRYGGVLWKGRLIHEA